MTPMAHLAAAKAAKRKRNHEEYGEIEVPTSYRIHFDRAELEAFVRRVDAKGYPKIKPENLRWTAFLSTRQGPLDIAVDDAAPINGHEPGSDEDAEGEVEL